MAENGVQGPCPGVCPSELVFPRLERHIPVSDMDAAVNRPGGLHCPQPWGQG